MKQTINKYVVIIVLLVVCMMIAAVFFYNNNVKSSTNNSGTSITQKYDIVIYGGGTQAVASALKASEVTNNKKKILMIVPENQLGSILTAGAQNLYDVRYYTSSKLPEGFPKNYPWAQGGSMKLFYEEPSIVFSPTKLAELLKQEVKKHSNITVLYEHDIEHVYANSQTNNVTAVKIYPLKKDNHNRYIYDQTEFIKAEAHTFIDASETGKLIYNSGLFKGVVGREDINKDKKQMVATLMFKLKGIDMTHVQKHEKEGSPFKFYFTNKGSLGILGGYEINEDESFTAYSNEHKLFRFKPYNAGEDGYVGAHNQSSDTEMWMNMFLVYDVDARKMWRDKVINNGLYPKENGEDPEIARELAISEIKSGEFISLIRKLPGMKNAELVTDNNNEPVVGEIMYVRESIHSSNEDGTFALTKEGTLDLGDSKYYDRRIGLGFYNFDSNTYVKGEKLSEPRTVKPWYVPYEVLTSTANNVLIPGYAANMDSYTWRAMRVYPNLIMLGDAAGIAAGLNTEGRFTIKNPNDKEIRLLQAELKKNKAILEK